MAIWIVAECMLVAGGHVAASVHTTSQRSLTWLQIGHSSRPESLRILDRSAKSERGILPNRARQFARKQPLLASTSRGGSPAFWSCLLATTSSSSSSPLFSSGPLVFSLSNRQSSMRNQSSVTQWMNQVEVPQTLVRWVFCWYLA